MDLAKTFAAHLPKIMQVGKAMLLAKLSQPINQPYPVEKYLQLKGEMLDRYERNLREGMPADPALMAQECPYCKLEELAGVVKNHLAFVAQECFRNKLGPATGGMVAMKRDTLSEIISRCDSLPGPQCGPEMADMAAAVKTTAQALVPKLEHIGSCAEANTAAKMADRMWKQAAKTAQAYYAGGAHER